MERKFSQEDSLRVINEMIALVKRRPRAVDSMHTLIWGYLVLAAALLHWGLLVLASSSQAPLAWLLMIVGLVVSVIVGRKAERRARVKTYIDSAIRQLWLGSGVVFALIFLGVQPDSDRFIPLVILLYGFAMWMQGALLKYRPYQAGAVASWICAGLAFLLPAEQQLLTLAASVLLGYILPGHLLYHQTKNDHV